ncbi:MAG TPA: hypothetical protein EYP85_11300, partial [Armatimonadetes bacterium]|nr:hypothetical protein [Armatimonadota bacterium]
MHRLFSAFFWGVVGLALTAGVAAQVELSRAFYELSPEVVTPHIPWAKPLAGGPIKALFLGPRAGQRETLELAQRLSLNWRTVLLYSRTQLGANPQGRVWERAIGAFEEDVKAQLQEALRGRYEVILLGNFDARRFPREVEYALLQQVHDGTGLVYAYADFGQTEHFKQAFSQAAEDVSQQFVTTGVPLAALPAFAEAMAQGKTAEDFVSCRQFKKGRVVLLTYPGGAGRTHFLTPNPPATGPYSDLYYEYYQSLLIKAVLWAARRVPAVTFADFPATLTFPRTAWPGPQLAFHLANRGPERSLEVEFTLRSPQGRVWARKRQPLRLGPKGASVAWPLPRLSGGRYFADVRLTENGQALNWATTAVRVESEVAFARLSVNPPSIEAGWPVTVQAELREGAPEVTAVAVEVVDARGRIVWRGSAPVPPGEKAATLRVRVAEPRAIVHWVRAALSVQGEVVDRAETSFSVVRREWDDVAFCLWPPGGGPHEFVHRQVLRTLRRYGVDTLTNCSTNPDFARAAFEEDLRAIPYMTRYFFTGAPEDRIRRPCLTEPQYRAAEERKLTTNAQVFAPHDPLGYTLGDECYFNSQPYDLCWSETCLADFRRYLREVYGTVERLNAEWGTNLQSFAEATPLPLEEARQTGQFARWVDHRLHVDSVFAAMLAFARDVIRRTDPQARVGFDGAFGTNWHNGYDWWKLMQEFSLCNVYFQQSEQVEAVRSFAQPGTLIGFWYGGYMYGGFFGAQRKEEAFERFAPWYTLLHGGQSIWWFAAFGGTYGGSTEVAISPSLTPYPCFQWTAEEVRAIKSGLGKLLLHTERQQDGLAVLYSQPSLYAATLQPEFGSHVQALRG